MSRQPGETAAQWEVRAAAKYRQALAALNAESRRLGLDDWRFPAGAWPILDKAYVGALDVLVAADDERTDASDAVQRAGPAAT
jgi:hypothetical protein